MSDNTPDAHAPTTFDTAAAEADATSIAEQAREAARQNRIAAMIAAPDITTKDQFFAIDDVQIRREYVPEWKGWVYIRTINGTARDRFDEALRVKVLQPDGSFRTEASADNVRAKYLAETLCDKDGNQIFTQADVEALGKRSAAAMTRIYNIATEINALSEVDVDVLAKNSESGAT